MSSITYDSLSRAVEQNSSGTYKQILYSPMGGKLALMAQQVANNVFLPLPGGEQATYTNSTIRFRHYDWQGSARFESNLSEAEYGDLAYAPFGETYSIGKTPYLSFTGQQQDTVSGLYDFLYRRYNPGEGRWISPDPAGMSAVSLSNPQSWNRYAYVLDNPLIATDPLGLDCVYDTSEGSRGTDQNLLIIIPGDCLSTTDGGFYFDGTVDQGSASMNWNGDVMATVNGTTQCSGECPTVSDTATGQPGTWAQLFASTVPAYYPNDVPLNSTAQQVGTQVGNITKPLTQLANCAGTGAATLSPLKINGAPGEPDYPGLPNTTFTVGLLSKSANWGKSLPEVGPAVTNFTKKASPWIKGLAAANAVVTAGQCLAKGGGG